MSKIEIGDEVIVNGERLYVEERVYVENQRKNWFVLKSKDVLWQCYDGYGEDRIVKESDMVVAEH